MPGSANEAGMHAEYIKLCGHESAGRHQNLERPLRELSARRRWIGTTAQLPCGSPEIAPHGAPENVGVEQVVRPGRWMGSAAKTADDPHTLLLSQPGPPVIAIGKQRAPDAEAAGNGIANSEDTLPDA